jgi:hypothetical protein
VDRVFHNCNADFRRLSQLTSSPQTPNPNLTRTTSSPAHSTPDPDTPSKASIPFPKGASARADVETSIISVMGLSGSEENDASGSRARRELSVIEERDTHSALDREEEAEGDALEEDEQVHVESEGPASIQALPTSAEVEESSGASALTQPLGEPDPLGAEEPVIDLGSSTGEGHSEEYSQGDSSPKSAVAES